jgi:GGDEF domain-containing protein
VIAERQLGPFRREGLLRRTAPFLVAMILAFAAVALPADHRSTSGILAAAALNALIVVAVVVLPWARLPRFADVLPPLAYMIVVATLRDALGGSDSAYATLLILPVLWLALYGTRVQLAVAVLGVLVLLAVPILTIGAPDYPDEEWRRALLWTFVSAVVGLAAQDLVEQVRRRAAALHTVSEAVGRRTREIETRAAICEAAKQNAGAQYALLLEPDANGRRLVTTAATDSRVEDTTFYLTDADAPAVRSFQTGRGHFETDVASSPLESLAGARAPVASLLFHPVPGRDQAMGVLVIGWTQRVKRLPETLPPVLEALAAEAAGVIERTTLLVRLETAIKVDEVTGLPNERAWEEEVAREISRARRQGSAVSVVIADLGEVEPESDGELAKPDRRLLRDTADRWRRELAASDFIAHRRPGCFGVILPGIGADDAALVADRLRALASGDRDCVVAIASWNGVELPAQLVDRAQTQVELERAAARPD